MTVDKDDKRLTFLPLGQAISASGVVNVIRDYHWCVCPDRGLIFFNGTPQANQNHALTEDLKKRLYPWAQILTLPVVMAPWKS